MTQFRAFFSEEEDRSQPQGILLYSSFSREQPGFPAGFNYREPRPAPPPFPFCQCHFADPLLDP